MFIATLDSMTYPLVRKRTPNGTSVDAGLLMTGETKRALRKSSIRTPAGEEIVDRSR